jgi:hemolysin III
MDVRVTPDGGAGLAPWLIAAPEILADHPRLRGRIHQLAAVASVAGLVWMIADAHTPTAVVAAVVYGLAAIALYATSSSYHLSSHTGRARTVLRRLDHSMIYVLIAGTYTPVCLLALHGSLRWALLAVVWAVAISGVVVTLVAFDRFPHLTFVLSLALGWAAVFAVPDLLHRPGVLALAALGGVLYTAGAILFALHWPGRAARWFGYHEYWHAFGVAAGAAFFTLNLGLIASA